MRSRRAAGFSLVEAVAVVAVVGVLTALLLAAVHRGREAARRAACASNLRQLGLALGNYAAAIRVFPPGIHGHGYSFHSMILPYLDHAPEYHSLNFHRFAPSSIGVSGENRTIASTHIGEFLCPSDRPHGGRIAGCNYAGNRGRGVLDYGYDGAFAFEPEGSITYAAFRDGTGTTAAMSEWLLGARSLRPDPRRSTHYTAPHLRRGELEDFAAECRGLDTRTAKLDVQGKGTSWVRGDLSYTLYNHVLAPGERSCINGDSIQRGAWTSGSNHFNGINILFVDGHVQFAREGLPIAVWRALGSRAGGEVVTPVSPD